MPHLSWIKKRTLYFYLIVEVRFLEHGFGIHNSNHEIQTAFYDKGRLGTEPSLVPADLVLSTLFDR
jgi:hypothetical protein